MNTPIDHQRRQFIKSSTAMGGSLILGIQLTGCGSNGNSNTVISHLLQEKNAGHDKNTTLFPGAFLRISHDESITIHLPCSEMGQGVSTSLPMLIAEELEADWSTIKIEFAPAHEDFENPRSGRQITGGSASIRGFWQPLREAGATAREMLLISASQTWGVDKNSCSVKKGKVIHQASNQILSYGQLVEKANELDLPETPPLKLPEQFSIIGKAIGRLDAKDKVTGTAIFGQDVQRPDMLIANIVRCPVFEGKLKSFDATQAIKINGIVDIFAIETGIAIVAKNYWATQRARKLLTIQWHEGEYSKLSSANIRKQFIAAIDNGKEIESRGDTNKAFAVASSKLEAIYETPYLAHACMEPMTCTAHVQKERCDIWVPTQGQAPTQKTGASITGLSRDQVYVHTTYLGGGFGRRAETDFVKDAVLVSKQLRKPVKVIWTREDDIQHDYYRPATLNKLSASIDANGIPQSWEHNIAGPSILHRIVPLAGVLLRGKDGTSTEGADNLPYDIANFKVSYAMVNPGIPVGFWRSVGNSQNGFVTECFIDEIARNSGQDPYQLRLKLLKNKPRHTNVLNIVAKKSGWGKKLPQGHYHGLAMVKSFDSYVAYVAEVSIDGGMTPDKKTGPVKVHKVTAAVDCGIIINPDTVIAQIESGIVYGLTAALYGTISINNGRVEQANFDSYPALRMYEMPVVDVHLVESTQYPGGVGEIGVPPIAPAVANAVYAASGKPVRSLPINLGSL